MSVETFASSRIAAYLNWKPGALLVQTRQGAVCTRRFTHVFPPTHVQTSYVYMQYIRILHHLQRGLISYSALSHSCLLWTILVSIDFVRNSAKDRGQERREG